MGERAEQKPVKLSVSLIYKESSFLEKAEKKMKMFFGETEALEKVAPFDWTDYYEREMGRPLLRKLLCFKTLVPLDDICGVKLITNDIESEFSVEKRRTVNIDPGYVTCAKLVLLTTKDYSHRIYIGRGIFAENTLFFRDGKFNPWPWTYPDYASEDLIGYFSRVRQIYASETKRTDRV